MTKLLQLLSVLCIVVLSAGAQTHQDASSRVDQMLTALQKSANLPGISVAVSSHRDLIYKTAIGYADVKQQQKLTVNHTIRTASVAKILTATALGKLASDGQLDFEAPIRQYVPYIVPAYADLTVRQLAGHTSGMPHRPGGKGYQKKHFTDIRPTVELMKRPLEVAPGEKYQYSTHAYNLLAAVIEGVTQKPYAAWMKDSFFKPLGMKSTFPEEIASLTANDARGYEISKGKIKSIKYGEGSYKLAGAGFRSTPTDLVKLTDAFSNGMLSEKTIREMSQSGRLNDGSETQVGIGWRLSKDYAGRSTLEHAGNWHGTRTVVVYYPEEQLAVSIMINARCQIFIEELAHLIAANFLSREEVSEVIPDMEEAVRLTLNLQSGPEQAEGVFEWRKGKGTLYIPESSFLKTAEVHPLGGKEGHALVTKYGLMYLSLKDVAQLEGSVFLYSTRNNVSPIQQKPFITFSPLN